MRACRPSGITPTHHQELLHPSYLENSTTMTVAQHWPPSHQISPYLAHFLGQSILSVRLVTTMLWIIVFRFQLFCAKQYFSFFFKSPVYLLWESILRSVRPNTLCIRPKMSTLLIDAKQDNNKAHVSVWITFSRWFWWTLFENDIHFFTSFGWRSVWNFFRPQLLFVHI